MTTDEFLLRLRTASHEDLPLPAQGHTWERFRRLMDFGREDLSVARLAEAHFDAVAILSEAGRSSQADALYGVWAAEIPGNSLTFGESGERFLITGTKMFCSGAGIIDRALVTVGAPDPYLIDIDLRAHPQSIEIDKSAWKASAFSLTQTATVQFRSYPVPQSAILGGRGWYLSRACFWHGAIGPACCWAGGASAIVDYASRQSRSDAHTLAHLGAMHALQWEMRSCIRTAAEEIDTTPTDAETAHIRALAVRHLVEQAATETIHRFARAYGPYPLAFDESISRRYQELDIYLRQCHGERDLEVIGTSVAQPPNH